MAKNSYRKLMEHLGNVGIGYPQSDDFLGVLEKTIDPEEAEIALGLPIRVAPFEVEDVDVIAARVGRPVDEVEKILERLAQKNYLYKRKTESGKTGYAFIQLGHGMVQIFYWKGGELTDVAKAVAGPLANYMKKGVKDIVKTERAHLFRYVPVNKAIDHIRQAVFSYDMMTEVVDKAKKIAVAHCSCRQRVPVLTGNQCTHSSEVCLKFNKMAEFIIDRGLGREITKEEALEKIRLSEEEGLIHFVDNCQDEVQHNCNCCACCCWNVMPIKNRLVPRDIMMATYYLRETDQEECTGCGQCAEDCPLDIIAMEGEQPMVDETVCIGCGVCLLNCPTEAAQLKKKDDKVPLKDFNTLYQTCIEDALSKKEDK
jgi:H+/Na+-translocating ferredoxin:NAD+ oxidoreductase subunit B